MCRHQTIWNNTSQPNLTNTPARTHAYSGLHTEAHIKTVKQHCHLEPSGSPGAIWHCGALNALRRARWQHFPSQLAQLHNPPWYEFINSFSSAGENTSPHCLRMIPPHVYLIDSVAAGCQTHFSSGKTTADTQAKQDCQHQHNFF